MAAELLDANELPSVAYGKGKPPPYFRVPLTSLRPEVPDKLTLERRAEELRPVGAKR